MSTEAVTLNPIEIENLSALTRVMESDDFYSEVAVASSPHSLFRRVTTHPVTFRLIQFIESYPENNLQAVLAYANGLYAQASGNVRSEKDAALCVCVVALARAFGPGVEDFMRRLRATRELSLKWPSELTELVMSNVRVGTLRTYAMLSDLSPALIVKPIDSGFTHSSPAQPPYNSELPTLLG